MEMYVTRALLPYLKEEIRINQKKIGEDNTMVLHHGETKSTTRRQHQQLLRGPGVSTPSTPRQRTLSFARHGYKC